MGIPLGNATRPRFAEVLTRIGRYNVASYNKIILMGNLTRSPEMKYLPSGTAVAEFGLAVNRKWKDKDGQQKEEVCFVDCSVFSKQAETLKQYMTKGRPILIEGRLQQDTWQDKNGQNRSKHKVVIERFQFLGDGQEAPKPPQEVPADEPLEVPADEPPEDDIPF